MAKATSLLKAYLSETIPSNGGFIISAFFQPGSAYSIYEITAYSNVKDIFRSPEGIVFKTDGNRTHCLVEPPIYAKKHIEPVHREEGYSIPYRFNEMTVINGTKSEKIMVPQKALVLHSSFTILEKEKDYYSFIFFPTKDVYVAIKKFMADSFYNDCNLTKNDSMEASKTLLETIKNFSIWD